MIHITYTFWDKKRSKERFAKNLSKCDKYLEQTLLTKEY
jgi:hypothetical protein